MTHDMTLKELTKQVCADSDRWFPNTARNLYYTILALNGEAGELANVAKKIWRGSAESHDAKIRFQLMTEAMDVQIYLAQLYDILNMDPDKVYQHVRANNEKRFGSDSRDNA